MIEWDKRVQSFIDKDIEANKLGGTIDKLDAKNPKVIDYGATHIKKDSVSKVGVTDVYWVYHYRMDHYFRADGEKPEE
jgi:hypothetical protein